MVSTDVIRRLTRCGDHGEEVSTGNFRHFFWDALDQGWVVVFDPFKRLET